MSQDQFASVVNSLGVPMNRSILANIESHRRSGVSVAEMMGFALALNVRPVDLLLPPEFSLPESEAGMDEVQVAPAETATASWVRDWLLGRSPLPDYLDHEWEWLRKAPRRDRRRRRAHEQRDVMLALSVLETHAFTALAGGDEKLSAGLLADALEEQAKKVSVLVGYLADELRALADDGEGRWPGDGLMGKGI